MRLWLGLGSFYSSQSWHFSVKARLTSKGFILEPQEGESSCEGMGDYQIYMHSTCTTRIHTILTTTAGC